MSEDVGHQQIEKEKLNGHDFKEGEMCIICGQSWWNVDGINRDDGKLDPCHGKPAPGTMLRMSDPKWVAAIVEARKLPIVLRTYSYPDDRVEILATCPLFPSLSCLDTDRGSAMYGFEGMLEEVVYDMLEKGEKIPAMPEGIQLHSVLDGAVKPE